MRRIRIWQICLISRGKRRLSQAQQEDWVGSIPRVGCLQLSWRRCDPGGRRLPCHVGFAEEVLEKSRDGRIINILSQGLCLYPLIRLDISNLDESRGYRLVSAWYQNKLALLTASLYLREPLKEIKIWASCIMKRERKLW